MKRFATALALAALLHAPTQANAQTNISQFQFFSPTNTVLYLPFQVLAGGTFTLETFGVPLIDPMISYYSGACWTGPCLGALLGTNDDGGTASGYWYNSRIVTPLDPGSYTVAMSFYYFDESAARAGSQAGLSCGEADVNDCFYEMTITSDQGVARLASLSVPEPASALLVGVGMFGLLGIAHRRRREDLEA